MFLYVDINQKTFPHKVSKIVLWATIHLCLVGVENGGGLHHSFVKVTLIVKLSLHENQNWQLQELELLSLESGKILVKRLLHLEVLQITCYADIHLVPSTA